MILPYIFSNPLLIVLWIVLGVLPAYYLNKRLLKLTRPTESIVRALAHIIIVIAFTLLYTSIMIFVLAKTVFPI
jgi:hypothetical protein